MMPGVTIAKPGGVAVDRRIWGLIAIACLFAVLVMKEVSLPSEVILGFGALGLLALLVVGIQSPEIPLYVLITYLPFSRMLVGDFGTQATAFNLTNILIVWVLIAHVLRRMAQGQRLFQTTPLNRAILVFCILGAASLLKAGADYGSWYAWHYVTPLKRWLTPMFLYFLAFWVVQDRRTIKTSVVIIMVTVALAAVMAIRDYAYVVGSDFEKARVDGIAGHPNALGAFFNYYMFFYPAFFLLAPKRFRSWLLLIPFGLCFRGIMVTFSRGAYLAFATGGAALAWFRNKVLLVLAIAFGVLALSNPALLPSGVRYRMGMTVIETQPGIYQEDVTQNLEGSAASRIEIWRGAVQMIKGHPWWGVGYEAFSYFIPRYTQGTIGHLDAHNTYLLIGAEMGIPTLMVFLIVLFLAWHYTFWLYRHTEDRSMKAIALGFLAGLAALWVANMFGSRMNHPEVSGYFWILCGLVMRAVMIERQEQAKAT